VCVCVCVFVSVRVSSCLQAFYKEVKTLLSFFYVLQCAKFFVVIFCCCFWLAKTENLTGSQKFVVSLLFFLAPPLLNCALCVVDMIKKALNIYYYI